MKRIEVTSCGGCPFNADDVACTTAAYGTPHVGDLHRSKNRDGSRFDGQLARPDWCPLDAGPVVVAVAEVKREDGGR